MVCEWRCDLLLEPSSHPNTNALKLNTFQRSTMHGIERLMRAHLDDRVLNGQSRWNGCHLKIHTSVTRSFAGGFEFDMCPLSIVLSTHFYYKAFTCLCVFFSWIEFGCTWIPRLVHSLVRVPQRNKNKYVNSISSTIRRTTEHFRR